MVQDNKSDVIKMKNIKGTIFQKIVWTEIRKIPKGKTITYKELAIKKIGKPNAYQCCC